MSFNSHCKATAAGGMRLHETTKGKSVRSTSITTFLYPPAKRSQQTTSTRIMGGPGIPNGSISVSFLSARYRSPYSKAPTPNYLFCNSSTADHDLIATEVNTLRSSEH